MSSSCPCLSNEKKLSISVQTALIAFVIFNPVTFRFLGFSQANQLGMVIHTIVFAIILYILMKPKNPRRTVLGLPLL